MEKATAAEIANLSIEQLPNAYEEARQSADKVARLVQLITKLLQVAGRDPSLAVDIKSEAVAVGFLHAVRKITPENSALSFSCTY